MKLFVVLMFAGFSSAAQKKWTTITRNDIYVYSFMALSGAADGVNQAIVHHYLGEGHKFWDFENSWKNKYWNWDAGDKRASFPGSKSVFVAFTDGFHLTRLADRSFTLAAVCISYTDLKQYKKKDRWKVIAKKAIISALVNRLSFELVFSNLHGPG